MALTPEDRFTITDLLNLHGHLVDRGDFAGMPALFTEDVTYDASAMGGGELAGLDAARKAGEALGDRNPVAHHITNIVLEETADGTVRALSKGLGVYADGTSASVTYEDTVVRGADGWRVTHRVIRPRREPLRP